MIINIYNYEYLKYYQLLLKILNLKKLLKKLLPKKLLNSV